MRYCKKCILPDIRPGLMLDAEGVCNACRNHERRKTINWVEREKHFLKVVENARSKSKGYDCLVPVSGGKDSTWQIVTCLQHGLNVLAVTWKCPARTEIGERNLANLVNLGVDHIDYQVNPKVERIFMLKAFERFGATAIPMHMALFNIPLRIASCFEIPLIVWGENSAFEYGDTGDECTGFRLNAAWLKKFGVTHGTTASDWISEELTVRALTPYFGPSEEELERKGILAVFLGYYLPWDPITSMNVAVEHGFRVREQGPLTGYYDYADIDDDFISIHHYLKWYKFGFTRAFDNLSLEIRNGRMSRDDALAILRRLGEQRPNTDIKKFCDFVGITVSRFFEIAEQFRNHSIWHLDNNVWKISDFLIPDWPWRGE